MVRRLNESIFDVARNSSNDLEKQSVVIQDLCTSIKSYVRDAVTSCLERYEGVDEGTLSVEDYIEFVQRKKEALEEIVPVITRAQSLLSRLDD